MKSIAAINVSPRKQGSSAMLLNMLKEDLENRGDVVSVVHLYSHLKDINVIIDAVSDADIVVISGPCYVNTYPADTTMLLEELAARHGALHGQKLYGIIQGGMPYAHTHVSGLNMLRIFAKKAGIPYQGGFLIGLGAMLDGGSLDKLPNGRKTKIRLARFFEHIHRGEESPDSLYEEALLRLPGIVTRMIAASTNRKIDKTFAARGMDARQPNPYLD